MTDKKVGVPQPNCKYIYEDKKCARRDACELALLADKESASCAAREKARQLKELYIFVLGVCDSSSKSQAEKRNVIQRIANTRCLVLCIVCLLFKHLWSTHFIIIY